MLTFDLVRVYDRGEKIIPVYIDPSDTRILEIANTLISLFQAHQGKAKGLLDDTLEEYIGQEKDLLTYRGFIKLLEERCIFEAIAEKEPEEIRQTLFQIASQFHCEKKFERNQVLQAASQALGIEAQEIERILYADLKEHHILKEFELISAEHLLQKYNTALAQAILYKATCLEILIFDHNPRRYRELFRAIKFHRLLYQIQKTEQGFRIILDGPMSLFQASQKYGLQMAMFLPALLLCDHWQLNATLHWKKKKHAYFTLSNAEHLYSHYQDNRTYIPEEIQQFKDRFESIQSQWEISEDCDILELNGSICIPDYAFIHCTQKYKIYLEIFGFWHKAALAKRILDLQHTSFNLILAICKKLNVDECYDLDNDPHLYFFQSVLNPKEILQRLWELIDK